MTNNQQDRVIKKLRHDGFITRNECLKNFISRLGAIICSLQSEGWEFNREYIKTKGGKDYKYTVVKYGNPQGKLI